MSSSRWKAACCAALAVVSLGCPDPKGTIDPGSAKVDDVLGYWVHWGTAAAGDDPMTVFGFTSAAEKNWELPLAENSLDAGALAASIVYQGELYSPLSAVQLATFEVKGGTIEQTVLGDRGALPGTKYGTKIFELTPRKSMSLESTKDPSGRRSYEWFERCPSPNEAGWNSYPAQSCFAGFSVGTALTFDRFGDLHVASGQDSPANPCQVPSVADLTRACIPRVFSAPDFSKAALAAGPDDQLRMAWIDRTNRLHLRERALRGDTWVDAVIDASPGGVYELELFDDALGRLLVLRVAETNGPTVYRWNGAGWDKSGTTLQGGAPFPTQTTGLARGPDGQLVFSLRGPPWVLRETATGYEPWPMEDPGTGGISSVQVDRLGRLHAVLPGAGVGDSPGGVGGRVVGNQGWLAVLQGGAWKRWPMPLFSNAWLVPKLDGTPRVVVALGKWAQPALALVTADGDGLAQELLTGQAPIAQFGSLPTHIHTVVKQGEDGTLAFTLDGQTVLTRPPTGPVRPRPAALALTFTGAPGARVRSTDGLVDCTANCTVPYPAGSRVELRVETQVGVVARLPCLESTLLGATKCFFDVRAPQTAVAVTAVRTPVRSVLVSTSLNGSAVTQYFGLDAQRAAFSTGIIPGATLVIEGVELPLTNRNATQGLAFFDRAARRGWHTELPVEALAVSPSSDGGAFALVRVTQPTAFGTVMVGTSGKATLARVRFDAAGAAAEATVLLASNFATVVQLANRPAAIAEPSGAAAVVVVSSAGFPEAGLTEQTVVATIDAFGAVWVRGIDPGPAMAAAVSMDQGQLFVGAFVSGGSRLDSFNEQGQRVGSRLVAGARVEGLSVRGGRRGVWLSGGGPVDLGGGALSGTWVLGEYDAALVHVASAVAPSASLTRGFGLLPGGGALFVDHQSVYRLSASLAAVGAGEPLMLGSAQQLSVRQTERGLGVMVLINQPTAVDGLRTVSGSVLIELEAAP